MTKPPILKLWRSHDADEISQAFSATVFPVRARPTCAKAGMALTYSFFDCAGLKLLTGQNPTGIVVEHLAPHPCFVIQMPLAGSVSLNRGSKQINGDQQFGTLTDAQQTTKHSFSTNYEQFALAIPIADVEKTVASLLDRPLPKGLAFQDTFRVAAPQVEVLRHVMTAMSLTADACCPLTSETLRGAALLLLAEGFSHTYSDDLAKTKQRAQSDLKPRHVKRAIDYMKAHAHEAVALEDIARASDVSVRTLQYGFKHFTGQSPMSFLQRIRLRCAIIDLVAADAATPTRVIVEKWGFTNTTRFTRLCERRTGLQPREIRQNPNILEHDFCRKNFFI